MVFTAATDAVLENVRNEDIKRSYVLEMRNGFETVGGGAWIEIAIKKNGWSKKISDGNPVVGTARFNVDSDNFLHLDEFDPANPTSGFSDIRLKCSIETLAGVESEYIYRGRVKTGQTSNTKVLLGASDYLDKMKSATGDLSLTANTTGVYSDVTLAHADNWDEVGTHFTFEVERVVGNNWAFAHTMYLTGARRSFLPRAFVVEIDTGGGAGFEPISSSEYMIDTAMGLVRFSQDISGAYVGIRLTELECFIEGTLELADVIEILMRLPASWDPLAPALGCGVPSTSIETVLSGTMTFVNGNYIITGIAGTDFHNELSEGDRISYGETDSEGNLIYGVIAAITPGIEEINLKYPYRGSTSIGAANCWKSSIRESTVSLTNINWSECNGTAADLFRELQNKYADSTGYKLWWDYPSNLVIGDRVRIKSTEDRILTSKINLIVTSTYEDLASAVRVKGTIGHAKNLMSADPTVYSMPLGENQGTLNPPWGIGFDYGSQPFLQMRWITHPQAWSGILTGTIQFQAIPAKRVVGIGTLFTTELSMGDYISVDLGVTWGVVENIINDLNLDILYPITTATFNPQAVPHPGVPSTYRKSFLRPVDYLKDGSIENSYAVFLDQPGGAEEGDTFFPFVRIDLKSPHNLSQIVVYNMAVKNSNNYEQGITMEGSLNYEGPFVAITPETVEVFMKPDEAKTFDVKNSNPVQFINVYLRPIKWASSDAANWPRFMGLREIIIFGTQTICETVHIQGVIAPGGVTGKTGTITFNAGGPPYTVTGVGTLFLTELQAGDSISLDGDPLNFGYVISIVDNFNLIIRLPYNGIPGASGVFSAANDAFDPYLCMEGEGGHFIGGYSHEDVGTTTGSANNQITDVGKAWTVNEWRGHKLRILSGAEIGEYTVVSNTATSINTTGMGNPGIGASYVAQEKNFIPNYFPEMVAKMFNFGHRLKIDDQNIVLSEMQAIDRAFLLLNEYIRLFRDVSYAGSFDPRNKIFDTVKVFDDYRVSGTADLLYLIQSIDESDSKILIKGTELGAGPYH